MTDESVVAVKLAAEAFADSANYEQARPDYSTESVKFLLTKLGALNEKIHEQPFTILELGCGTGKFTRVMVDVLKRANGEVRVIASDPVETMVEQFRDVLPDVEMLKCHAEDIALPDSSVDVVVAAHCFHWFANEAAVKEIRRVLLAKGTLGMIWNLPDESVPWVKEVLEFVRPLEKQFQFTISKETMARVFEEVGKFFAIEENTNLQLSRQVTYESCYQYFASKGVLRSSSDEIKLEFKTWFDKVMRKHFSANVRNEFFALPFISAIYWCEKND